MCKILGVQEDSLKTITQDTFTEFQDDPRVANKIDIKKHKHKTQNTRKRKDLLEICILDSRCVR